MKRVIILQHKEFLMDVLHIFVLFSFALSQPLFDLLSRNAEFFVAHHSEPIDVILLILILCVLLPGLAVLIEVVAGLFGRRVCRGVHGFMVAGLLAVIALPALNKIFELPGTVLLGEAAILGVAASIAYFRFHPLRTFLSFLTPALVIFPGLLLFNSPVYKVLFPGGDSSGVYTKVDATAPVIIVIFDEFPVTSLMDERRQVDPIRYPNFAALARDAYWFRNATTVSDNTTYAIPAMLTGNYADPSSAPRLPVATEYPGNIFTLFGGSYDLKVFEPITQLCPDNLCSDPVQILTERISSLMLDLSIVYLHILLPRDFTSGLPDVTQTLRDFAPHTKGFDLDERTRRSFKDVPHQFEQFLESITPTQRPTLYFVHVMLPHFPWMYLPSRKRYSVHSEADKFFCERYRYERWVNDEFAVVQGYRRHLLQVGFVDSLVGKLLDKLRIVGLYDRSLIIITADHGISFRPGDEKRLLTQTNYPHIMPVPLFIKAPNQHGGVISDRNVELIDVLPTIADILDIPLPWQTDGHSALDSSFSEKTEKVIFTVGGMKEFVYGPTLNAKYDFLDHMLALFASGVKPDGLVKIGPHSILIGQHVSDIEVAGESGITVELDQGGLYEHVDPDAPFVPAHITGRAMTSGTTEAPLNLVVSLNGIIRAVTRTYTLGNGIHEWSAIVPELSFRPGRNDIKVFIVSTDSDGKLNLIRTRGHRQSTYSFSSSSNTLIRHPDGTSIPVIPGALIGFVDAATVRMGHVSFTGWAADVKNSQVPDAIVIFANGKFFYSGHCNVDRPDVVKAYDNPALQRTGFKFVVPFSLFKDTASPEVRIFGVSKKGVASELNYPKGYKWGKKS